MFGLSWESKPRRGRIFSRPGRDLTPRNNFWLISKTRLPRPLTSPVASLAIRKHCSMYPHPWTSCLGLGFICRRATRHSIRAISRGYSNEIQIAGSDAAIGHNPGINEAAPIASKAIRHSKGRSPHQPGHFTRGRSLLRTRRAPKGTTARQRRNGRARRPMKKKKTAHCGRRVAGGLAALWLSSR